MSEKAQAPRPGEAAPLAWQRTPGDGSAPGSSAGLVNWPGTLCDLFLPRHPLKLLVKLGGVGRDRLGGRLVRVPTALCMNPYAYTFGESGWNYYRDLASELLRDPDTPFPETRFYRFFQDVHAPSFTDNLCFHDPGLRRRFPRLPYGSLPWGIYEWEPLVPDPRRFYDRSHRPRRSAANGRNPYFEYMFYEKSAETLEGLHRDFLKLSNLVRSFRESGYRPLRGGGYLLPTVGVLVRDSGERRFLVKDGNHRLGMLAALGCREVWVRFDPMRFPAVYESDLGHSPWVQGGLLTLGQARELFALLFELTGAERARALGIACP